MIYAQFYYDSTGYVPGSLPPCFSPEYVKPIEACGSDGVAVLDGRLSLRNLHREALRIGIMRGKFNGYKLMRGETFTRSGPVSEFIEIKKG